MASELPGTRGVQLGRLNAVTNAGQILGTALCGFSLALLGFKATFAVLALIGLVSFSPGWGRTPGRRASRAPRGVLAGFRPLLRHRIIQYSVLCAYLSALPFLALDLVLSAAADELRLRGGELGPAARPAGGRLDRREPVRLALRAQRPADALAGGLRRDGGGLDRLPAGLEPRGADRRLPLLRRRGIGGR